VRLSRADPSERERESRGGDQTVRETRNKNVKGRSYPQAHATWIRLLTGDFHAARISF